MFTRATVSTCGWAVSCIALALSSCGGKPEPARPHSAPSSSAQPSSAEALSDIVRSPERLGEDFVWRQRLTAAYGEESFSFQAVVEKTGTTLNLLFLTPFGSRALLLQQTGTTVKTQYFVSQRLPFPARYILSDLYRVYLPTAVPTMPGNIPPSPRVESAFDDELFVDHFVEGALKRREIYANTTRKGVPAVVVQYADARAGPATATEVTLENRAHGYRIEIETLH